MVSGGAGERDGSRQQKGSPRTKVGTKGRGPVGCVLSSSRAPLQGTGVEKGWRLARLGVGQRGNILCVQSRWDLPLRTEGRSGGGSDAHGHLRQPGRTPQNQVDLVDFPPRMPLIL